jgi:toxin HigB-1
MSAASLTVYRDSVNDLKEFYSIRIKDQWRVIIMWIDGEVHDVRIVDYH